MHAAPGAVLFTEPYTMNNWGWILRRRPFFLITFNGTVRQSLRPSASNPTKCNSTVLWQRMGQYGCAWRGAWTTHGIWAKRYWRSFPFGKVADNLAPPWRSLGQVLNGNAGHGVTRADTRWENLRYHRAMRLSSGNSRPIQINVDRSLSFESEISPVM